MTTRSAHEASTTASYTFYTKLERRQGKAAHGENLGLSGQQDLAHPCPTSLKCGQRDTWEIKKDRDLEKTKQKGRARYQEAKRRR